MEGIEGPFNVMNGDLGGGQRLCRSSEATSAIAPNLMANMKRLIWHLPDEQSSILEMSENLVFFFIGFRQDRTDQKRK